MAFIILKMQFTKLIILCFVGFCQCYRFEEASLGFSIDVTPEIAVDIIKRMVGFIDKQIMERLWATEEATCDEVSSVLDTFSKYMESDLNLLFMDAKKHLKQVPAFGNRKMKRCMQDIREQIEEAVQDGVETFESCAEVSRVKQSQEKAKTDKSIKEYKQSINYTLSNIDKCLDFSNKASQVHRDICILDVVKGSFSYFEADPKAFFSESKCMAQFSDLLLNCTSSVLNKAVLKKKQLKEDISQCVGYAILNNDEEELRINVKDILSQYTKSYRNLSNDYSLNILNIFSNIILWQLEQQEYSNLTEKVLIKNHLQAYYNALEKTKEDNRSPGDRKCYYTAIKGLDNLVSEFFNDDEKCISSSLRKTNETFDSFIAIVTEFNTQLQKAGHVAFLKCFDQRPQNIFSSNSAKDCAELAARRIYWERKKVEIQLSNLMESLKPDDIVGYGVSCTVNREYIENTVNRESKTEQLEPGYSTSRRQAVPVEKIKLGPNGDCLTTCGKLRREKLILDADVVLNSCSRCLYEGSGDSYAVTTLPTYTSWTLPSIETPRGGEKDSGDLVENGDPSRSPNAIFLALE